MGSKEPPRQVLTFRCIKMDPLGFEAKLLSWNSKKPWMDGRCMLAEEGGGSLAVFQAADLQAAFHRDETGGEEGGDAEHEALDAVPAAHRLSEHPGVTQAGRREAEVGGGPDLPPPRVGLSPTWM